MNIKHLLAFLTTVATAGGAGAQALQNPPCNICGDGGEITNPDAVLHIPDIVLQDKTCAEFAIDGQNGLISEMACDLLPSVTMYVCDCQVTSPSPLPSTCQFCTNGITIKDDDHSDIEEDNDAGGVDDGFEYTMCQRLVKGAKTISADSTYCENLHMFEYFCCPSNNLDGRDGMSYGDYSYLYYTAFNAKGGKAKTPKGKHHKSKADKSIRARE